MPKASAKPTYFIDPAVLTTAVVRRTAPQATPVTTTAPTENAVYKVMFSEEMTPEQKRDEVAKFLTFEGSKEENRARVKAYQEFEEYMQTVREQMAQEIIRLTDTETFSELQSVYNDLNNALIDFDNRMKPLTDIVGAIYVLRTNEKTLDAFREIQADRQDDATRKNLEQEKERQFADIRDSIGAITSEIAGLSEKRSFFGFGNITEAARQEIAQRNEMLARHTADLNRLEAEIADLDKPAERQSTLGEFAEQKDKLRELLDISSDEHKQRQRDLVKAALNYVTTAKERIGEVRKHLTQMNDQVDHLYEANSRMSGVYAVLSEGIQGAGVANKGVRDTLLPPAGEEGLIAKMTREDKKSAVEDHIRALDEAGAHTVETYADLTSQTIRIKTMRDANQGQMDKARVMHTQGVAGVADRLSVVLQAVSSAALGESSAIAKDTLTAMVQSTNKVAQQEVIRTALGINEMNDDVVKAIDDLGAYGEVMRASTDITRAGLAEMRGNLAKIKELAESVRGDVQEAIAVHAETPTAAKPTDKPNQPSSPFGLR